MATYLKGFDKGAPVEPRIWFGNAVTVQTHYDMADAAPGAEHPGFLKRALG